MIIERANGEDVEVRQLSPEEAQHYRERDAGADLTHTLTPNAVKQHGESLKHRLSPTFKKFQISTGGKGKDKDEMHGERKSEDSKRSSRPSSPKPAAEHESGGAQQRTEQTDEGHWTEEEGPDAGHETSSASNTPRRRSRSRSRSTGRPRAGSRQSQTSARSARKSRSPPKVPRERKVSETETSSPEENDTATQSAAEEEHDRSRPPHRVGSGLLLAPGQGVGFGTSGHYSRSSSPSRSIRFIESMRPDRHPESSGGKGSAKPRKRSRLGFTSSKASSSRAQGS